jgi:hypothetical protein
LVQTEHPRLAFPSSRWHFLADFPGRQRMRRAKALFIGCENPARFALEAEFAPIRYFIFASFAVSLAIFAVKELLAATPQERRIR